MSDIAVQCTLLSFEFLGWLKVDPIKPVSIPIHRKRFLPARRYASAGYSDRNVSVCPSVYTASNLKDLFHNIHPKRIFSFVHAIGLTNKL